MKNLYFVVVISKAPDSINVVFSVSNIEPKNDELRTIWKDQGLRDYGVCSDLIEVFESTQLEKVFLGNLENMGIRKSVLETTLMK